MCPVFFFWLFNGWSSAILSGNMLDNTELVETLEEAKTKAAEVSEKLLLASKTAKDIDAMRDGYRLAARRGAVLFFVLAEMASINTMYQVRQDFWGQGVGVVGARGQWYHGEFTDEKGSGSMTGSKEGPSSRSPSSMKKNKRKTLRK